MYSHHPISINDLLTSSKREHSSLKTPQKRKNLLMALQADACTHATAHRPFSLLCSALPFSFPPLFLSSSLPTLKPLLIGAAALSSHFSLFGRRVLCLLNPLFNLCELDLFRPLYPSCLSNGHYGGRAIVYGAARHRDSNSRSRTR